MKTEWSEEFFTEEKGAFEKIAPNTWIQRRDVIQTEDGYKCISRKISSDVYENLKDTLYTPAQELSSNDNIDIMDSIADVYILLNDILNKIGG